MNIAIQKKYIIKGILTNESPLLIGGGQIDKTRDIAFVKDYRGKPYIPGTSLAGCLKSYFEEKYEIEKDLKFLWGQKDDYQAHFIIDDAFLNTDEYVIKIRDGVKINNETGRAIEHGLYNYESLEPKAKFTFKAEIVQRRSDNTNPEKFLNTFLRDFISKKANFQLGALSSFGFGKMKFDKLEILEFEDVGSWIKYLQGTGEKLQNFSSNDSSYKLKTPSFIDIRVKLKQITAFIARDYSQELTDDIEEAIGVIRSDTEDASPDSITLLSNGQPVLTSKTVKGALRAQAVTIVNTIKGLADKNYQPSSLIDQLFGKWIGKQGDEKEKSKSILTIEETVISKLENLQLHQRVSIDRFTGGAVESKLFNSVPVYPDENPEVELRMKLQISKGFENSEIPSVTQAHLGLLIFILRDLNDKLFSIGGEKAIGRGLFDVLEIKINRGKEQEWKINMENLDKVPSSWIKEFHNQIKQ